MNEIDIPMNIPMPGMDNNIIESDFHMLVSNTTNSEMIPFEDEEGIVPGLFESHPEYTVHKLYIGDFMEQGKGFFKIINKLQEVSREDILELHISSYGGSVAENIQLYNLINSMYSSRCTSYLNHGYSAGFMTFMMGKERIIYKHSDAMAHFFSGSSGGKGSDMLHSLTHSIKTIDNYYRRLLSGYFTDEELDLMINHGKEYWLDATEMMNRGIATGIIMDGVYMNSEEYFEKYNKKGNIRKSWKKKQEKIAKEIKEQEEIAILEHEISLAESKGE